RRRDRGGHDRAVHRRGGVEAARPAGPGDGAVTQRDEDLSYDPDDFEAAGFGADEFEDETDYLDDGSEPDAGTGPHVRLPVVAVVGRPNVGKSTLVNRILGRRQAVVEDVPGVTRDRVAYDAEWTGRRFTVVDTGGWDPNARDRAAAIAAQA